MVRVDSHVHTHHRLRAGNAMNMGQTLAVYATLCRESDEPFIFPGSHEQWNALTDVTDARILAQQLVWGSEHSAAHGQAYNISNGRPVVALALAADCRVFSVWSGKGPAARWNASLEPRIERCRHHWKRLQRSMDLRSRM